MFFFYVVASRKQCLHWKSKCLSIAEIAKHKAIETTRESEGKTEVEVTTAHSIVRIQNLNWRIKSKNPERKKIKKRTFKKQTNSNGKRDCDFLSVLFGFL